MDERLSGKLKTKTLRRKHKRKLHDIRFSNDFLDTTPKTQAKKKNINQTKSKFKNFYNKQQYQEREKAIQSGRKYLKIMYLIQDLYLEYVNNP